MSTYRPCQRFRTDRGQSHRFDFKSGWCVFGCGQREDGRSTNRDGIIWNTGPSYTDAELAEMAERMRPR